MRRKLLAIILCVVMGVSMVACGNQTTTGDKIPTPESKNPTATSVPEVSPTPTPITFSVTDYDACVSTTTIPETYLGIEVVNVTDTEAETYVQEIWQNNPIFVEEEKAAELGSVVDMDYVGTESGVAFEGGTATGAQIVIGSGRLIDGFEDGLVGLKKGDKKSLNLTFPENYGNELAGKAVVFDVTVNAVGRYEEYNDNYVQKVTESELSTVQEFHDFIKKEMQAEKEYNTVLSYLVDNSTYGYINEAFLSESMASTKSYYEAYATSLGVDIETFLLYSGVYDVDAFWKDMEDQMRTTEKQRMTLYCIAKKENITITEEDFQSYVELLATDYQVTAEEYIADQGRDQIEKSYMMEKALDLVIENIVTKE